MLKTIKQNSLLIRYLLCDGLAVLVAWLCTVAVIENVFLHEHFPEYYRRIPLAAYPVLISAWLFYYSFWGLYHQVTLKSRIKELINMLPVIVIGCLIVSLFYIPYSLGVQDYKLFFKILLTYTFFHYLSAVIVKTILMTHTKHMVYEGKINFKTLLIGNGPNAGELHEDAEKIHHLLGWKFEGYLEVDPRLDNPYKGLKRLGDIHNLEQVITEHEIVQVVIAVEPEQHEPIRQILDNLEAYDVRVAIIPDLYQIMVSPVSIMHLFSIPLIELERSIMPLWQQNIKRIVDIIVSVAVLVLGSPFFLVLGIITRTTSRGPALYKQERIGKNGIPFYIYKFRSMYVDAEKMGPALSSDNDHRITPWGKFMRKTRLDELPQFYNVLIGDMAIVGPRPEREFFMKQIMAISPHFKYRLRVKPGITSLAQVKFGYAETVEEMLRRIKYDIFYIKNMSLMMDLRIILFTILTVIKGRGK